MNNKGKKVVTSLAVLAGLASGAGALNMFVNRTVKSIIYRHHTEDDKPVSYTHLTLPTIA